MNFLQLLIESTRHNEDQSKKNGFLLKCSHS